MIYIYFDKYNGEELRNGRPLEGSHSFIKGIVQSITELKDAKVFTHDTIEQFKAAIDKDECDKKLLLSFGIKAFETLQPNLPLEKYRGSILEYNTNSLKSIPHMGFYLLHEMMGTQAYLQTVMRYDIIKARDIYEGTFVPFKPVLDITYEYKKIVETLSHIYKSCVKVGFDIEYINNSLTNFAFSYYKDGVLHTLAVSLLKDKHSCFTQNQETVILFWMKKILEKEKIKVIIQNASYECFVLYNAYHIRITNIEDTMGMMHYILPGMPKDLGFITSVFINSNYHKDIKEFNFGSVDYNFAKYNALDAAVLMPISEKLITILKNLHIYDIYKTQASLIMPLTEVSTRGIQTHQEGRLKAKIELEEQYSLYMTEFNNLVRKQRKNTNTNRAMIYLEALKEGVNLEINSEKEWLTEIEAAYLPDINPASPKQLQEYFYNELKIYPYKGASKKAGSTDSKAIKKIASLQDKRGNTLYPQAMALERVKKAKKLLDFFNIPIDEDNRIRSSYNPFGTKFSRLSSRKNPYTDTGANLQNQPKAMKQFYIASKNHLIYEIDLSQAEARLVAYAGEVSDLIHVFENNIDIHSYTASLMFNIPYEKVIEMHKAGVLATEIGPKTHRTYGKSCVHSLNYGLMPGQLSVNLLIEESKAKILHSLYHGIYPQIKNYWHKCETEINSGKRYLENPFGRRLYYQDYLRSQPNILYSFIPQSTVGDIINQWGFGTIYDLNSKNYDIKPEMRHVKLLNQVHDSIVFEISKDMPFSYHENAVKQLVNSLETTLSINYSEFIIPADVSVGHNLKDLKEIKLDDEGLIVWRELYATKI